MNISVITPTVRPKGLSTVEKSLNKQTVPFEWIVVSPDKYHKEIKVKPDLLLSDPPKEEGDFWTLCKGWNKAYAHSKGELIINIQDHISFPKNTLERFWKRYVQNPRALVTAVGDHYKGGKKVWDDPRKRMDQGYFYRIDNPDMEMSMCSIPRRAIWECGGIDEEYDKGPGVQEKEMCLRLEVLGWEMWIDQTIEYKAEEHGRLTEDWDDKYWSVTAPMYKRHVQEMLNVERPLNVGNIEKYLSTV